MIPLLAFTRFEVGRLFRSWKFLIVTVGFPVVFYMLFLGDHSPNKLIEGAVPWRSYLLVSMCSFGSLVAALTAGGARLSAERTSGWARQLRVTPIPTWSYVVTKVTATMLVVLPVVVLVEGVGVGFGGVHLGATMWFELSGLLWLSALPFAFLGVFIGFLVHAETAFPVVTALMFALGYFGGLFVPVTSMPHALQLVAHTLPSFHNTALGVALLAGQRPDVAHWLVLLGYEGCSDSCSSSSIVERSPGVSPRAGSAGPSLSCRGRGSRPRRPDGDGSESGTFDPPHSGRGPSRGTRPCWAWSDAVCVGCCSEAEPSAVDLWSTRIGRSS